MGIKNRYSTPAYPQGNGQAKAINKVIIDGLKKRLKEAKGKWVNKLSHVLWMYHTTPRKSTRETPFSMMYGSEAIIPLETGFPTMRSNQFNSSSIEQILPTNLDLAEERKEVVTVRLAQYQQKLRQG